MAGSNYDVHFSQAEKLKNSGPIINDCAIWGTLLEYPATSDEKRQELTAALSLFSKIVVPILKGAN